MFKRKHHHFYHRVAIRHMDVSYKNGGECEESIVLCKCNCGSIKTENLDGHWTMPDLWTVVPGSESL